MKSQVKLENINAEEIIIGEGVVIEEGVIITGHNGPAKRIVLGDYCFIGHNTKIMTSEFMLGDFSKLHSYSFAHGKKPLRIGRNCWIGSNTVLDSEGGLDIDDNVGIGAHSQLWTHIQFGDIVEGCRFFSQNYMHVGKDAWFVGHCIVSPVNVGEKSMALVGSVITKDMHPNHIYGGSPAKDLTDKIGKQFDDFSLDEKAHKLQTLIDEFVLSSEHKKLKVIKNDSEIVHGIACFNVSDRTYTKSDNKSEVFFLKRYTPLVKFVPYGSKSFIKG